MQLPKHIIAATDFSDASKGALGAAAAYAAPTDARVTLVHVYDPTPMVPPAAIPAPKRMEEQIGEEMRNRISAELQRIRAHELPSVSRADVRAIRHPNPAVAICELAKREGADLIIVGTHGRTGLGHMLIGSVAERVVRHAPCPVLTVPSRNAQQT